jgi:uncharacterized protein YdaU (DUF1376 family)
VANAPWYKRFAADFVADPYVRAMTYEQQGWFSALLDLSWIHTPQAYLPNDKQMLSKCLGLLEQNSQQHFIDNCGDVLGRFQTTQDGRFIYHPKMLEQAVKMGKVSESRADAGRKGGQVSAKQLLSKPEANAKQLPVDSDVDSDKRITLEPDECYPSDLIEEIHSVYPKPERSQRCLVAIYSAAVEVSRRLNLGKPEALRHLRDRAATYKRLKSGFWVGETKFFAEQIYRQSDEVWKSESTHKPVRTSDVPLGRAKWEGLN